MSEELERLQDEKMQKGHNMYDFIKPELDAQAVVNAAIEATLDIDPNASHAEVSGKYTVSGNPELVAIEQ